MWAAAPTPGTRGGFLLVFLVVAFAAAGLSAPAADAARKTLYVSPKGSDRNACTSARPCRTFARAYRLAGPGATVLVRRGHYRKQTIPFDARKRSSKDVVFRPPAGAGVTVAGQLGIFGSHVEIRGIEVGSWSTFGRAVDVTVRGVTTSHFSVLGSRKVRVLGGSAGPASGVSNVIGPSSALPWRAAEDVTLDGIRIQGFTRSGAGPAVSCLEVGSVERLTVRDSRLYDCEDFGLRLAASSLARTFTDVLVENNLVSCCLSGGTAVSLDAGIVPAWSNVRLRSNSIFGAVELGSNGLASGVQVLANIASGFTGCGVGGVEADYNVWTTGLPCGPHDTVAPNGFADPGAHDFELLADAAAIDRVAAGVGSTTDIDGVARPLGSAPDAGAIESLASGLVAAYPLNESAGTIADDASVHDNAGTVNGASWTQAGRFGGGLAFDGVDDWVTVLDDPSLDLTNRMTLEGWVRPDAGGTGWRTVVMKEQTGALSYALYGNTDAGRPSGAVNVGTEFQASGTASLPVGKWTHLAATYDGASLRLYVNGKLTSTRAASGSLASSTRALRLGGNGVWDEWFDGTLDEVRVYNRALTAKEVSKDMRAAIKVAADNQPPTAPASFVSTSASTTSISVSWSAATDDSGVAGYGVYRDGASVGSTATTSYSFTGLTCGTTYSLAVDAFDSAGNRSAQTTLSAATSVCPPPDTQPPTAPGSFAVTGSTQTSVSVSWSASTDDVGVTGYSLFRDGTSAGSDSASPFTFSGLLCGTTYTLGIEALDAAGNHSQRSTVSGSTSACPAPDTTAPTTPGGLALTGSTQSSLSVSWNASTDNVGVSGYGVYKNGTSVGSTAAGTRSYTYGSLACGTSYTLAVDAYDAAGNRSGQASLTASTSACPPPPDTTPPTTPSGLAVTGATQSSLSVSWNASTDNVGVSGYGVYKNGTSVGSTAAGTRSYTYGSLACGTSYTLAVDAYDAAGNRSGQASLTASTSACPPPPGPGSANLWMDTNGGSCTRQSPAGSYVDAQACASLTAAYNAASAGDVIVVAGGTYGRQVVPSGTKAVTIRSAAGATVTFGTTSVNASNVTMIGFKVVRNDDPGSLLATFEANANGNVFDGIDVDTKNISGRQGIYAHGDDNVFKNGSSYNVIDEKAVLVGGTRVTFDNYDFHDVRVVGEGVHNECVYSNGPNLTIKNSRFWNCATMDLFITRGDWWGQPLYGGITLINNVFGHSTMDTAGSWHYYGLGINGGIIQEMRNWTVINNTFETQVSGGGTPAPGTIWANNVGSWDCFPQATFSHNVGTKCVASDKAVSPAASCGQPACPNPTTAAQGWVNPSANDFHLKVGAPAIDAADPAYAPALDKDGKARVGPPDAGAYEFG